ncbi:MAG: hypothetical protein RLN82_06790 [Pseudomonadales bacterium]
MNQIIGDALLYPAQQLVNALLRSDPYISKTLGRFNGKVLAIHCTAPPLQMVMLIEAGLVRLVAGSGESAGLSPDATVKGNSISLLSMLLDGEKRSSQSAVEVRGDAEFLLDLQHCIASLDLRWDDYLAPLFGDVLTRQLAEAGEDLNTWSSQARKNVTRTVQDYLQQEVRLVASRRQGDQFNRELALLKQSLDRAEARLNRIKSRLAT